MGHVNRSSESGSAAHQSPPCCLLHISLTISLCCDRLLCLLADPACATSPLTLLLQEKLQAALVSWAYPESAWEAEAIAALATGKPSLVSLLNQRLDVWRRAFISAYMAVRHGRSSGLYLISPEVGAVGKDGQFSPTAWYAGHASMDAE